MTYLIAVSLIWAFSFGLIKGNLTGLDSNFVSFARMSISLIVFLPFLRARNVPSRLIPKLLLGGALQYGMMYLAYIYAFQFLQAYEVALFTIFTPVYVTLLNDWYRRRINKFHLLMAFIAVAGTAVIVYHSLDREGFWLGFWVVQLSNLCFAFGQIYYREMMRHHRNLKDRDIFAILYLGAVLLTGVAAAITTPWQTLTVHITQIWTLLYLGVLASGLCFFWWNAGARKVNAGSLAILNNLKVPLGVSASILFFGESGNVYRLLIGGVIILTALWMNERQHREKRQKKLL